MQLVAGDEIKRWFEVGRDFVGDDSQFEAVRRVSLAGGQAGQSAGSRRALQYISSSQLHFRCPFKSLS